MSIENRESNTYRKTEFAPNSAWMDWTSRHLPDAKNFFLTDIDLVVRTRGGCLMLVEIKRQKAEIKPAQNITLQILDQLLRKGHGEIVSFQLPGFQGSTRVEYHGLHLLQFQNTGPDDGHIFWDHEEITADELKAILGFSCCPMC